MLVEVIVLLRKVLPHLPGCVPTKAEPSAGENKYLGAADRAAFERATRELGFAPPPPDDTAQWLPTGDIASDSARTSGHRR